MGTLAVGQRVRVVVPGAEWDGEEATVTGVDPLDLWDYEVKMDRYYNDEGVPICDPYGITWFDEDELEEI